MLKIVEKIKGLFIKEKPFEIKYVGNTLQITVKGNINLIFENDVDLTIDGDINIVSNNFYLDTRFDENGSKMFLNSRMAKQIKDLDSSIKFRQKLSEFTPKMKEISDQLTLDSVPMSLADEEKIKQLSKLIPLDITNAGCM